VKDRVPAAAASPIPPIVISVVEEDDPSTLADPSNTTVAAPCVTVVPSTAAAPHYELDLPRVYRDPGADFTVGLLSNPPTSSPCHLDPADDGAASTAAAPGVPSVSTAAVPSVSTAAVPFVSTAAVPFVSTDSEDDDPPATLDPADADTILFNSSWDTMPSLGLEANYPKRFAWMITPCLSYRGYRDNGIYRGLQDQKWLNSLSEFQRELILTQRYEIRRRLMEYLQITEQRTTKGYYLKAKVSKILVPVGYSLKEVRGDGHCMFHALVEGYQDLKPNPRLNLGRSPHSVLRKLCVKYVMENLSTDLFTTKLDAQEQDATESARVRAHRTATVEAKRAGLDAPPPFKANPRDIETLEEYERRMMDTEIIGWGGQEELRAASLVLNVKIIVHVSSSSDFESIKRPQSYPNDDSPSPVIHLLYSGRNHYDLLKKN
jgi:hypothetical protein